MRSTLGTLPPFTAVPSSNHLFKADAVTRSRRFAVLFGAGAA